MEISLKCLRYQIRAYDSYSLAQDKVYLLLIKAPIRSNPPSPRPPPHPYDVMECNVIECNAVKWNVMYTPDRQLTVREELCAQLSQRCQELPGLGGAALGVGASQQLPTTFVSSGPTPGP